MPAMDSQEEMVVLKKMCFAITIVEEGISFRTFSPPGPELELKIST